MNPGKQLRGQNGIDRVEQGIPSEQEYVEHYCTLNGLDRIDNWSFYLVFGFFRMAAILQDVKNAQWMAMPLVSLHSNTSYWCGASRRRRWR